MSMGDYSPLARAYVNRATLQTLNAIDIAYWGERGNRNASNEDLTYFQRNIIDWDTRIYVEDQIYTPIVRHSFSLFDAITGALFYDSRESRLFVVDHVVQALKSSP